MQIYGLDVVENVSEVKSAPKLLIVYSKIICGSTILEMNPEMRSETTLLFIVLSYIFMKDCEVPESNNITLKYNLTFFFIKLLIFL